MRKFVKIAAWSLLAVIVGFVSLAFLVLRQSSMPLPTLTGSIESGKLQFDGRTRSWISYQPVKPAQRPALIMVLHSSMGSGQEARAMFGYDFDVLADQYGFIVVYPQGFEGHWNDCKIMGPYAAKRENIDDSGFLQALAKQMVVDHNIDPARIYVTGVSNGGSMTLCLALKTPEFARAYAVVAASVPTPENMSVAPKRDPVSILFMNGTSDPINPWQGGDVVLWPVLANRGPVLSTPASVEYFRLRAGLEGRPLVSQFPDLDPSDDSTVELSQWSAPGRPSVALYAIKGGGHLVPHPAAHGMYLLGNSNRDIHAANEIWEFFQTEAPAGE